MLSISSTTGTHVSGFYIYFFTPATARPSPFPLSPRLPSFLRHGPAMLPPPRDPPLLPPPRAAPPLPCSLPSLAHAGGPSALLQPWRSPCSAPSSPCVASPAGARAATRGAPAPGSPEHSRAAVAAGPCRHPQWLRRRVGSRRGEHGRPPDPDEASRARRRAASTSEAGEPWGRAAHPLQQWGRRGRGVAMGGAQQPPPLDREPGSRRSSARSPPARRWSPLREREAGGGGSPASLGGGGEQGAATGGWGWREDGLLARGTRTTER
ncbi:hypothetical protein C2845_PM09G04000 [Panicum miliaceum]|uniref:Uncharacterized protein n=1 Tax=Panicum miliaceum TaxID=4540 RepID=A0A3L6S030_PANMI|nr:hypothetical protein C2845_PM09G04000 [Panicum miliaceum]